MKSIIKINDKLITGYIIENGKIMCILENRDKIFYKDSSPIVYCIDCNNTYIIKSPSKLLLLINKKEYRCHKCSIKGERNPFYGKSHSIELKKRFSSERKGLRSGKNNGMYGKSNYDIWLKKYGKEKADELQANSNYKNSMALRGEKNPFYGKKHTKESIDKIIESNKKYVQNKTPEDVLKYRIKLSDAQLKFKNANREYYTQIKRKAAAISNSKQTSYKKNKLELMFENFVNSIDLPIEYAFILNGKYQYDFRIKNTNLLIEIDGDYWHGNPLFYNDDGNNGKRKLNDIQKQKRQKDYLKELYASNNGWKMLRFWENDIKNNKFKIGEILKNEIQINTNNKNREKEL